MASIFETVFEPQPKDIGGFTVRRALPSAAARAIGPFVFFDEMGPGDFAPGTGLDVRPHPHIGLATVTYLFEGGILHRDSLGTVGEIVPGDVNWMTAGRGIVHSERTGPERRARGHRLHGIQAWVGLPQALEDTAPVFEHLPADALPAWTEEGVWRRLVAGVAWGRCSSLETASPTFYAHAEMVEGSALSLPDDIEQRAVYVVAGRVEAVGEAIAAGTMAVLRPGASVGLEAVTETCLMVLGGAPLDGRRHLRWNLVASDPELIERAERDWTASIAGGFAATRFTLPPDEHEHIPLPGRSLDEPPEPCPECPTS